jgi:hypothetical protein
MCSPRVPVAGPGLDGAGAGVIERQVRDAPLVKVRGRSLLTRLECTHRTDSVAACPTHHRRVPSGSAPPR